MLKWVSGRQANCNYKKLKLWQIGNITDAYILKYPPHAKLPEHTDPVPNGKHYRLNIELYGSGDLIVNRTIFKLGPVTLFRPDIEPHAMYNGPTTRIVLSLGSVY